MRQWENLLNRRYSLADFGWFKRYTQESVHSKKLRWQTFRLLVNYFEFLLKPNLYFASGWKTYFKENMDEPTFLLPDEPNLTNMFWTTQSALPNEKEKHKTKVCQVKDHLLPIYYFLGRILPMINSKKL